MTLVLNLDTLDHDDDCHAFVLIPSKKYNANANCSLDALDHEDDSDAFVLIPSKKYNSNALDPLDLEDDSDAFFLIPPKNTLLMITAHQIKLGVISFPHRRPLPPSLS